MQKGIATLWKIAIKDIYERVANPELQKMQNSWFIWQKADN